MVATIVLQRDPSMQPGQPAGRRDGSRFAGYPGRDPNTQRAALRKLLILDAAETLDDARIPPGNHLEKLRGDRSGQYSIRVNQQWRICFRWSAAGPEDIEIIDYH